MLQTRLKLIVKECPFFNIYGGGMEVVRCIFGSNVGIKYDITLSVDGVKYFVSLACEIQ